MNRLTKRTKGGIAYTEIPLNQSSVIDKDGYIVGCRTGFIADRLAAYEDTGLEPEDILSSIKILSNELNNALAKLKVYRNLEEQGLLIELPCKVGESYTGICQEMVPSKKGWTTKRWLDSGVVEKIEVIVRLTAEKAGHSHGRNVDELGEFWFIGENQREEAEKALKELEEINE